MAQSVIVISSDSDSDSWDDQILSEPKSHRKQITSRQPPKKRKLSSPPKLVDPKPSIPSFKKPAKQLTQAEPIVINKRTENNNTLPKTLNGRKCSKAQSIPQITSMPVKESEKPCEPPIVPIKGVGEIDDKKKKSPKKFTWTSVVISPPKKSTETTIRPIQVADNEATKGPDWRKVERDLMAEWPSLCKTNNFQSDIRVETDEMELPLVDECDYTNTGKKAFRFFWWHACEDLHEYPGHIFLFGKTYHEGTTSFRSCCVVVKNVKRKLYLQMRDRVIGTDRPVIYHNAYKEIRAILAKQDIRNYKLNSTRRKCFDSPPTQKVMELVYPMEFPLLEKELLENGGKTFHRVLGTSVTTLERFLLDRQIKGPSWLLVSEPIEALGKSRLSSCTFEVICDNMDNISVVPKVGFYGPLSVIGLDIKTAFNSSQSSDSDCRNDIVMISGANIGYYWPDNPQPEVPFDSHFCLFTSPKSKNFPPDLETYLPNYKATTLQKFETEKDLLVHFVSIIERLDPDLVLVHDSQVGFLCKRLKDHKIVTDTCKIFRLKNTLAKNLGKWNLFTGRLCCDIKYNAKEQIKSRSFDLETLRQIILGFAPNDEHDSLNASEMFNSTDSVLKLVSYSIRDVASIVEIMYKINMVPLALEITAIAGNLLYKTLTSGASNRIEFLLLHTFNEADFVSPDRKSLMDRGPLASFEGGLVLDPIAGFYNKSYILAMDFNSLYPSIITEFNICPSSGGVLPKLMKTLVQTRLRIKLNMSKTTDKWSKTQLDIKQKAIKLLANSVYGFLGYPDSRFYTSHLAALITQKGREILTRSKELVEEMNFRVIYGDTDSLMIDTNTQDYDQVIQIASTIKQKVNERYKNIELDLDSIYKFFILMTKKRYAACVLTGPQGGTKFEYKGLDIIRRDWCKLACQCGEFALEQILSSQPIRASFKKILRHLRRVRLDLEQSKVPLSQLTITKELGKNPDSYVQKNPLGHVQVARRINRNQGGNLKAGDSVSYVICDDEGNTKRKKTLGERSFHLSEVNRSSNLKVDLAYYLSQQILPVVSRICECANLDLEPLSYALGLSDGPCFNFSDDDDDDDNEGTPICSSSSDKVEVVAVDNPTTPTKVDYNQCFIRNDFKYKTAFPFQFKCGKCASVKSLRINCALSVFTNACACGLKPLDYLDSIKNQLIKAINGHIRRYYGYELVCRNPLCGHETNRLPLSVKLKEKPVCDSCDKCELAMKYTEYNLYTQLCYFRDVFNLKDSETEIEPPLRLAFDELKGVANRFISRSGYPVVTYSDIFANFGKL